MLLGVLPEEFVGEVKVKGKGESSGYASLLSRKSFEFVNEASYLKP